MPYSINIKEGARLDILDAYRYYEDQQPGLGERFLEALQKKFDKIILNPEYYSFIDSKRFLRDAIVAQFPYLVVFAISGDEVKVYAVCHMRRNLDPYSR